MSMAARWKTGRDSLGGRAKGQGIGRRFPGGLPVPGGRMAAGRLEGFGIGAVRKGVAAAGVAYISVMEEPMNPSSS